MCSSQQSSEVPHCILYFFLPYWNRQLAAAFYQTLKFVKNVTTSVAPKNVSKVKTTIYHRYTEHTACIWCYYCCRYRPNFFCPPRHVMPPSLTFCTSTFRNTYVPNVIPNMLHWDVVLNTIVNQNNLIWCKKGCKLVTLAHIDGCVVTIILSALCVVVDGATFGAKS